jgi:sulfatase maturation enzyme AslB (radical SAM superfamily)
MQRFERQVLDQGQFRTDHEKCRRCFAKLICGGGCYTQSYDATGRFDPCEERTCELIREKARIDLYFLARLKDEHPATFAEWGGILD